MKYAEMEKHFAVCKSFLHIKPKIKLNTKDGTQNERQEAFSVLSSDDKHKIILPQLELYTLAVSKRSETLPIMATLAAALIAVSTISKDLIVLSLFESKFLLSLFLLIIPVTLHHYININEKAARNAMEIVGSYQGKNISKIFDDITFLNQLSSDFPRIIVYVFYSVVFFVFLKIWFFV